MYRPVLYLGECLHLCFRHTLSQPQSDASTQIAGNYSDQLSHITGSYLSAALIAEKVSFCVKPNTEKYINTERRCDLTISNKNFNETFVPKNEDGN